MEIQREQLALITKTVLTAEKLERKKVLIT